jgi:arylsulfatase A-like enzyme
MSAVSRRDFLKASAALAGGAALAGVSSYLSAAQAGSRGKPNILIFVFDAMSAHNLSLYGYPRDTTPHLQRFAERASVYNRHYATSNFTTPGTASILTGMEPWTHRAFNYRGMIHRSLTARNLFQLVGSEYTRLAFTQNLWADILLSQLEADLDIHLPADSFSQAVHSVLQPDDLPNDRTLAYYAFQDFLNLRVDDPHAFPGSLLIASADLSRALASDQKHLSAEYPRGLPTNYDYAYENTDILTGIGRVIESQAQQSPSYLAYFHLWSPHDPYNARRKFIGRFPEDAGIPPKPRHMLSATDHPETLLRQLRREYDEFIADLDAGFGRLLSNLEASGALQNSYVIVTSDHGELFERGEFGHASALLYAPVTHIPLLISAPGQTTRADFHSLTSSTDLLPTILHMTGREVPDWVEGRVLPGFDSDADPARAIFAMAAKDNPAFQPLRQGTFSMLQGPYELIHYTGYPGRADTSELYHLEQDPHELMDLYKKDITVASRMKDELLAAVEAANRKNPGPHS